jgi:hypothetical protein
MKVKSLEDKDSGRGLRMMYELLIAVGRRRDEEYAT